jgi:hypothetical protein
MNGKVFKIVLFSGVFIVFLSGVILGGREDTKTGLSQNSFSLSFNSGRERRFSKDDFLLNIDLKNSGASVLSFASLPKGSLKFKGKEVLEGQMVSFGEIEKLSYYSESESSDFFNIKIGNTISLISMVAADEKNSAPFGKSFSLKTASGISVKENFPIFDSDGDSFEIRITKRPEKGILEIDGLSFCYTPFPNEKGKDGFYFIATDEFGNYSSEYTASLEIGSVSSEHRYIDTSSYSGAFAASKLSEKGIFQGENIGGLKIFQPDKAVDTGKYILLLDNLLGYLSPPTVCFDTGLSSNEETKDYLKPYIKTAADLGVIEDYNPSTPLSKEKAYYYAAKMLGLEKGEPTSILFPSLSLINPDYLPAYLRLLENGYIPYLDTENPTADFTRNDMARLLYNISEKSPE